MPKIPKTLHYFWGMSPDGKPWSLVHYVCVKSAIERIRPDRTFIYYEYPPSGPWWRKTRAIAQPVRISAPRRVFGRPLNHPAHRADVARLDVLLKQGGIYLDVDVLVHEAFDHLLDHSAVLGQEGVGGEHGLGNAVILAEPGAPFLRRWHEEYRWFRSAGRDRFWNEHSISVPSVLAKQHPDEITVLPHTAFYWPLWTDDELPKIFDAPASAERGDLANHLWESPAWSRYLENLTPAAVRTRDSSFHRWARPYLAGLPDDYGAPELRDRLEQHLRRRGLILPPIVPPLLRLKAKLATARQLGLAGSLTHLTTKLLPYLSPRRHRRKVFSQIYREHHWGGPEPGEFYSGEGSRGPVVDQYVTCMARVLNDLAADADRPLHVVDLGCGDFEVGRRLIAEAPGIRYTGCDIVPELCAHLSAVHGRDGVSFRCVDAVSEDLPDGDVCLIRQVLQHLSNDDIKTVLRKLHKYKMVCITESYPVEEVGPVNPDKPTNLDVRFDWRAGRGRGVELDKPPFSLRTRELLRVPRGASEILVTFQVDCAGGT